MTFTLIERHPLIECPPLRYWHAEHIDEGDTKINVDFFEITRSAAEAHLRRIFPDAEIE